ncbi:LOW QUALITY PROTEIN: wall-associated receptor kinase 2 [Jatropha curcas]|uniref:LOW QUALITY PROTEIN: wall-associated receptor kinase 2 n=1 Tax=Jatropha curcas TaxID=180498 RepID=UPI001894DAC6|nr:LOW QUALITY PROTEIN: wall-associated receptor kinase 2 [Jatropha curcas]
MLPFWFVIFTFISQPATSIDVISSSCHEKCGDVLVPYPFGIIFTSEISNPDNCALNKHFILTCNVSDDPPSLFFGENMPIHNISIEEGTISVRIDSASNCYNETGITDYFSQHITMRSGRPVRFSDTRNKFTVVGCDTLAYMEDDEETFGSGCISLCDSNVTLEGPCSGRGCCQTPLPRNLTTLNIQLSSLYNHSRVWQFNHSKRFRQFNHEYHIDECKEPDRYKCDGTCKNTDGNYTCSCPLGMRGDGKVGCQGFRITTIAAIVGGVASIMVIALLIIILYKRRRNERNFLKNGGLLLKHQRVRRIFTEAELVKATKNYDQSLLLGEGGFGYVYKGVLADNTQVAVKKPKDKDKTQINQEFQQELGIVSQVNHRNVVKVLGLCLETNVPLLVYEFISHGTLSQHIHYNRSKILATWKNRLRVAAETALALDYLHSLADPPITPIIHGDVKSCNILLDDTYTAKVSDFGASVLISTGQSDMATRIQGTIGYLDPEYLMTGNLTEKSDVYSFGVVLVELLTGEKPNSSARSGEKSNIIQYFLSSLENNELSRILCFDVASETEMEEIEVFAELAKQCVRVSGMKRPTMKQV